MQLFEKRIWFDEIEGASRASFFIAEIKGEQMRKALEREMYNFVMLFVENHMKA